MKQKTKKTAATKTAPAAPVPPEAQRPPLTAEPLESEACQAVTPYRHPQSARTVAYHYKGHAYTVTGLPCGQLDTETDHTDQSDPTDQ